jgi:ubiquinone/menaquinone biosynthesis C-methylase UbiE
VNGAVDTNLAAKVKAANIRFHERQGGQYEQTHADIFNNGCQERIAREVADLAQAGRGGRFLDLGCGTGNLLRASRSVFRSSHGCDLVPTMLNQARRYSDRLLQADFDHLPYRDETFDVVATYSVLHHVYDAIGLFQEAHRVLAPGGIFFSDHDPNEHFLRFFWWQKLWRRMKKRLSANRGNLVVDDDIRYAEYHHFFSRGLDPEVLAATLRRIGFARVEVRYRFPDQPDAFTRRVMRFTPVIDRRRLCYYFSLWAQKASGKGNGCAAS